VRDRKVDLNTLELDDLEYPAGGTQEHFLSYVTPDDRLAGFLRLSFPGSNSPATGMPDLDQAAIIREVHIYGQSLPVGAEEQGAAQHIGLGSRLIQYAQDVARSHEYRRLAVISAVGTRRYYQRLGFQHGELYMLMELNP
jgi:elongator complex protein 3